MQEETWIYLMPYLLNKKIHAYLNMTACIQPQPLSITDNLLLK